MKCYNHGLEICAVFPFDPESPKMNFEKVMSVCTTSVNVALAGDKLVVWVAMG